MRLTTQTRENFQAISGHGSSKSFRVLSVVAISACVGTAQAQWTTVDLDAISGANLTSNAFGVWGDRVVGQRRVSALSVDGALWTDSPGGWTQATAGVHCFGVSEDRIVGVSNSSEAFIWGWNGTSFPNGQALGPIGSSAEAIRGDVVVGLVDEDAHKWVLGASGNVLGSSLRPSGLGAGTDTAAVGTDGVQHVGWLVINEALFRAALWNSDASGFVSLHPGDPDFFESRAYGVDDGQQVGVIEMDEKNFATLWTSTAGSYVNLSPAGVGNENAAFAVFDRIQVGEMTLVPGETKATLWRGDAASALDLHQFLPVGTTYEWSRANAVWAGPGMIRIGGTAWTPAGTAHAIVWTYECAADFAAPWGQINFFDMAAFIALFQAGDSQADIAAPFGTFNFFDVSAYTTLFNAGCP